jgi:hypothetical protein
LADLLVSEVLAPLQGVFTVPYRIRKAGFFLEVARQHVLYQVVRVAALSGGRLRQLCY